MLICKIAVQRYFFFLTQPNIFCTFAYKLTIKMKKYIKYSGFLPIITGIILQIICFLIPEGNHNALLVASLILVISGIVLYIYMIKKDSLY